MSSSSSPYGVLPASAASKRTSNPIRRIVDGMKLPQIPDKPLISLSIGDPTVFGNMRTHETTERAIRDALATGKFNGYGPATGYAASRKAVAQKYSTNTSPLTEDDVVLTSGCSGAIEISLTALANEGDNVLVPLPGFSLYRTICESKGIEVRYYRLRPEADWEVNLEDLRALTDDRTRAIIVNNPSNPCGSVYSREHLMQILHVAESLRLPILADEIYANMAFSGSEFIPMASLTTTVPVLAVGGTAKQYLVPGWRLGWILIHDRHEALKEVRAGIVCLAGLIVGPNTLVQAALPHVLHETPQSYYDELIRTLELHAETLQKSLSTISGLHPVQPRGAMYMMVGIDVDEFPSLDDDVVFSQRLLQEENVYVLPGSCFQYPNFVRLVTCPPVERLQEACTRIAAFCERHRRK